MIVILAEKPSAARNFATALGGRQGSFESEEYMIVNALGHLYGFPKSPAELVVPEKTEQYSKWQEQYLPWNPADFKWKITPIDGRKDAIDTIKSAFAKATEVCIATDNDASGEGDLLAWEILIAAKYAGKVTRMLFDDESPKSVQKAFRDRKEIPPAKQYGPFVKAQARTKFDYLSMQFTRMATILARNSGHKRVVRQGRLKSVMVYLVGQQLDLINNYKKQPYYEVRYKDENGNIFKRKEDDSEDFRFDDPEKINMSEFNNSEVVVSKIEKKFTQPGKLLDLAGMSSLLATKGFNPGEVLATYQKMYEEHIVSYPRTDDKQITQAQFEELRDNRFAIADLVGIDKSLLTHDKPRKKHVTDSATHGANRPGSRVPKSLDALDKYGPSAKSIYEVLAKNSLAIFGEDYEYEHQEGYLKEHPEFIGSANLPISQGFKSVFDSEKKDDDDDDEGKKPLGKSAEPFIYEGANPKPKAPTMKWLVGRLEKYNVGTGATRTSTIEDITNGKGKAAEMQLLKQKRGKLTMAPAGELSYILLKDCYIASPEVTETLFKNMAEVGEFSMTQDEVINSITPMMQHDMQVMKRNSLELPKGNDIAVYQKKDKVTGVFAPENIEISFNRKWGSHEFTDSEIDTLLAGKTIEFDMESVGNTGNYTRHMVGKLAKQKYKGISYYGFKQADKTLPDEFFKHKFTAEEKKLLKSGKSVVCDDLWSEKKQVPFAATLTFNKRTGIKMSFGNNTSTRN